MCQWAALILGSWGNQRKCWEYWQPEDHSVRRLKKYIFIQMFIPQAYQNGCTMADCVSWGCDRTRKRTHNVGMGRTVAHWDPPGKKKKNPTKSSRSLTPGCAHWYAVCVLSPVNYCWRYRLTESNNGRLISRRRSLPLAVERGLYLENGFHFDCHRVYSISLGDNCEADRWPNTRKYTICSGTYAWGTWLMWHYLLNVNTNSLLQLN